MIVSVFHTLTISTNVDIDTLSRLTGKDFSGPTPELKTPNVPIPTTEGTSMTRPEGVTDDGADASRVRKKSRTPAPADDVQVEVMGDIDSFDPGFGGSKPSLFHYLLPLPWKFQTSFLSLF